MKYTKAEAKAYNDTIKNNRGESLESKVAELKTNKEKQNGTF